MGGEVNDLQNKTKQKTNKQRAASDPYHNAFQLHRSRQGDSKSRKLTRHTKHPRRQCDAGALLNHIMK